MATASSLPGQTCSAGGEFAWLKAESQRLRRELLCSGLEISYTIATFYEGSHNEALDESCRNAARKTLDRLEHMLGLRGSKDGEIDRKLNRLRAVLDGSSPRQEEVQHNGTSESVNRSALWESEPTLDPLTRRENEVLKYIAQGNSTKKVAEILGITFKTAACHRYRVMDKLGIHETANLVRYAIRHGMVEP